MRGVSRREDPPMGTARKNIAEKQRPGHAAGALFAVLALFAVRAWAGAAGDQRPDMALSSCTFCRMAASACWGSAALAVASSMGQRPVPVRFRMDSATSSQV